MKLIRKVQNIEKEEFIDNDLILSKILSKLDEKRCPYIIVEDDNGSYMQVAGNPLRLTIEYRDRSVNGTFKHFVLGHLKVDKTWRIIRSGVGDLRVMNNEVLDINVAEEWFSYFMKTSKIKEGFNKRNVTKQFK